jgi:hypothetical protein
VQADPPILHFFMRSGGLAALEWLLGEAPHGYIRGLLQTLAHLFMRGERCLWDTSCPFVVLIASQDVASRIVIAIEFGPTIGARVPAHCEVFGYQLAIATALLAGVLWETRTTLPPASSALRLQSSTNSPQPASSMLLFKPPWRRLHWEGTFPLFRPVWVPVLSSW